MKKLKLVSIGLTLALIFTMLPTPAMTGLSQVKAAGTVMTETDEKTDEGSDEETADESTWEIIELYSAEDLVELSQKCNLDVWSKNKQVILQQDISLTNEDFQMIPIFSGIFDGNGHTISDFHSIGEGYANGFFRYIGKEGIVKNLTLKGNIEGSEENTAIGSLCGVNYGSIENCVFQGSISGRDTVGGIAGINGSSGFISNCTIRGLVSGYYMTGGIAGLNHGAVTYCKNYSGINNDSKWVEEDDEMGSGLLLDLGDPDAEVDFYSGVDTGGIAGYSDGTLTRCTNYGQIGYEHTGYNIGGIVGRHAGVTSLCTNEGQVYGRKDVGGIVGQMEPDIEIDEAASLKNSIDRLHELIQGTLGDIKDGKNILKADFDNLASYGEGALDHGYALADQLTAYINDNTTQLHEIGGRLEYVTDQLPAVLDDLAAAGDDFTGFTETLHQVMEDMKDEESGDESTFEDATARLREASDQTRQSSAAIQNLITNPDGSTKHWRDLTTAQQDDLVSEILDLTVHLSDMTDAAADVQAELNTLLPSEQDNENLETAASHLQDMAKNLQNAVKGLDNIINYLNSRPNIQFTELGDDFSINKDGLNAQLEGISNSLKRLNENASDYSDIVHEDLSAVNDQLTVVFQLLADNLSGFEGLNVEALYEEISDDEIDSVASGRTDACTNSGIVKGDINIGGIAGSMAIDEEDPEDNAAGSIDYEIGRRFILKCVITDCVNKGQISAKKDGAGGIAGYMAHGVVTDSEAYGSVESTEGGYAGGVCGESLTVIQRCYALCDVSGSSYVGGIAGYATTLKGCYAIVNVKASSGSMGAIAGQISDYENAKDNTTGNISENYYVGEDVPGIDSISYASVAEPVTYEELLSVEGLPSEFSHLTVTYRIEDVILGTEEVAFGKSLAGLHYPEIPAKEGNYGVWPDYSKEVMKGNLIVEGEYHENVRIVESSKQDMEGTASRPYALAEQTFTEDTVLTAVLKDPSSSDNTLPPTEAQGQKYVIYDVTLENGGIGDADTFPIRLLNPYEDATILGFSNGTWTALDSKTRGQYLQVDMTGSQETFCIIQEKSYVAMVIGIAAAAIVILLLIVIHRKIVSHRHGKTIV